MFTGMRKRIKDAFKHRYDVFVSEAFSIFRVISPKISKKYREIYLRICKMITLKALHTNLESFS